MALQILVFGYRLGHTVNAHTFAHPLPNSQILTGKHVRTGLTDYSQRTVFLKPTANNSLINSRLLLLFVSQ